MRAGPAAALLAALLAACADGGRAIRAWEGCLERTEPAPAVRACGQLTLRGEIRDTADLVVQVRHTLPLGRLMVRQGSAFPPEGWVDRADDLWRMQLGTDQSDFPDGVTQAADDGSFMLMLQSHGDSLSGAWQRTCFAGCPEQGTAGFRRVRP